jgi:hypothetical protein
MSHRGERTRQQREGCGPAKGKMMCELRRRAHTMVFSAVHLLITTSLFGGAYCKQNQTFHDVLVTKSTLVMCLTQNHTFTVCWTWRQISPCQHTPRCSGSARGVVWWRDEGYKTLRSVSSFSEHEPGPSSGRLGRRESERYLAAGIPKERHPSFPSFQTLLHQSSIPRKPWEPEKKTTPASSGGGGGGARRRPSPLRSIACGGGGPVLPLPYSSSLPSSSSFPSLPCPSSFRWWWRRPTATGLFGPPRRKSCSPHRKSGARRRI